MSLNIELLRQSFEWVTTVEPELTKRFYDRLFADFPQTRGMFGAGPDAGRRQQTMLRDALVAVMEHLDDAPWLSDTLMALGRRHVGYGVTDEMYDWVGASLLGTLADVAGDAWTPELEAAWTDAFGVIASLMKTGAQAPAVAS